jgi:hypothetical protein
MFVLNLPERIRVGFTDKLHARLLKRPAMPLVLPLNVLARLGAGVLKRKGRVVAELQLTPRLGAAIPERPDFAEHPARLEARNHQAPVARPS